MTVLANNIEHQSSEIGPENLLRALLEESRELTAVERFAKAHEESGAPAQQKYYRDLIPSGKPGDNQQYAFDVDLDACSGCKACVSACHHLNGLESTETWRSVGQLHGQNGLPIIQHVTTACHHCVDPGCLSGCPTNAYEKDPETGIVRHLDDQCFGCQYCTMACPYEVPQYSPSKGIVRKCDMCHGRLAAGEAPACVQACPNQAIRITVVDLEESLGRTSCGVFLPDSPPADLTHPTTIFRSKKSLPENLRGADADHAEPQHAHFPLVVMLVLTQLSVGLVSVGAVCRWLGGSSWTEAAIVLGMIAGQTGLAVAPLHLGRPHLAFRAVLGWRHSWLSREALMFGVYAASSVGAALYALLPHLNGWLPAFVMQTANQWMPTFFQVPCEIFAILGGASAVYCSAKIYIFTGREFWKGWRTYAKFGGTTLLLGLGSAAALAVLLDESSWLLLTVALLVGAAKLSFEASLLTARSGDLALSTKLHWGPLRQAVALRFALGMLGCFALVTVGVMPFLIAPLAMLSLFAGELVERWLYFSAVVPLRMPGGAPTNEH